jgi:hypothetical protein
MKDPVSFEPDSVLQFNWSQKFQSLGHWIDGIMFRYMCILSVDWHVEENNSSHEPKLPSYRRSIMHYRASQMKLNKQCFAQHINQVPLM